MSARRKIGADKRAPTTADAAGRYGGEFTAAMFKYPGAAAWHFVQVPDRLSPPVRHPWGRTPVAATVDGHSWRTSVWRGKDGKTVLAIPMVARGGKGDGDTVVVQISFDAL